MFGGAVLILFITANSEGIPYDWLFGLIGVGLGVMSLGFIHFIYHFFKTETIKP